MSFRTAITGTATGPGSFAVFSISSVAFWSFLLTQFLGAFNDNYFKQLVLLTCLSNVSSAGLPNRQPLAMAAFALPFVLLSGLGGYLSDRCSRQRVIVGCKTAEVCIMGIALGILLTPSLSADAQLLWLISVLCLMGAHSAIFGPSKYGILPELFVRQKLRPVNGAVQMTTFLAIIFGAFCAGIARDRIQGALWIGGLIAIGIAVTGTLSSLLIPRTRVAVPSLALKWENLAVPRDVARLLLRDRGLLLAILVASVFWFLGGVTQMAVNTLGKSTMGMSDTRTSLMVSGIGIGIAVGCGISGFFGRGRDGHRWVVRGSWMLFLSLSLIALLGSRLLGTLAGADMAELPESGGLIRAVTASVLQADLLEWALRISMVVLGMSAGMFVVPIQVYLQEAPPPEFKGRLLGVMNLANWIGILLSAAWAEVGGRLLRLLSGPDGEATHQWAMFVSLAVLMLPICLLYRLPVAAENCELSDRGLEAR